MTRYNLYTDGLLHAGVFILAIEAGSEWDQSSESEHQLTQIGAIEAVSRWEYNPNSSTLQSSNQAEYIETGLAWPNNTAVVVH